MINITSDLVTALVLAATFYTAYLQRLSRTCIFASDQIGLMYLAAKLMWQVELVSVCSFCEDNF